jgi:hypothetical protein
MPDEKIKTRKVDKAKVLKRLKELSPESVDEIYRPDMKGGFVTSRGRVFEPVDQTERNKEYRARVEREVNQYPSFAVGHSSAESSMDPSIQNPAIATNIYEYGTYNPRISPPRSPKEIAAAQLLREQIKREPEQPEAIQARMAIPEVKNLPDPNQPEIKWPESQGEYEDLGDGFWTDLRTNEMIRVTPPPALSMEEQLRMIAKAKKFRI